MARGPRARGAPALSAVSVAMIGLFGAAPAACASVRSPSAAAPGANRAEPIGSAEWVAAREQLRALEKLAAARPEVETVRVTLRDGRTGRSFDGRGAVAIRRGEAFRMILLGPGGATALDIWATRERYRLAVPALGILRRSEEVSGARPAPPIGFFRWWFLQPFAGRVLSVGRGARRDEDGKEWTTLLRGEDGSTTEVRNGAMGIRLRRMPDGDELNIDAGPSGPFGPGARLRYESRRDALTVEVIVESVGDGSADADAFTDPEAASRALPAAE